MNSSFWYVYYDLKKSGLISAPRGLEVLEIENYNYTLEPYERFVSLPSRKMNLDYVKRECLWYLKGDKYDTSICEHAKMWKGLINSDGSINSNYGQYVFGKQNQFDVAFQTLANDKDSRRASIVILSKDHLADPDTKDYPCTYSINFRIRADTLNMTVRMRSQDAVFGMTNDAPNFSFIHEMMYVSLRDTHFPDLKMGKYHHSADSFHIYSRHFRMLDRMLEDGPESAEEINCPKISGLNEVTFLRNWHTLPEDFPIPEQFKFTKWLTTFKKRKNNE